LAATDGVTYERLKDARGVETSELIAKTTFGAGSTLPAHIVRAYDPTRDPQSPVPTSQSSVRSGIPAD
jgi:hypothetical protein